MPGATASGICFSTSCIFLKIGACRTEKTALEVALEIGGPGEYTPRQFRPYADVAQLVRASDCGSEGRWFESTRLYHSPTNNNFRATGTLGTPLTEPC